MSVSERRPSLSFLLGCLFLLILLPLISGCSANGRFYPVQGPLSTQTPPPVYVAKFTVHPHARTLTVSVALSQGQQVNGTLTQDFPALKDTPATIAPLSKQWDAVYGQGSYVATVLGQGQDARGVLAGAGNVSLQVEVHWTGAPGSPLEGVAEDTQGNLYKVAF